MKPSLVAELLSRSGCLCECGCGKPFGVGLKDVRTFDHMFGRAKAPEDVAHIWALRWECHAEKTRLFPSAEFWMRKFITHAERHGYSEAAERARARLQFVSTRSGFKKGAA